MSTALNSAAAMSKKLQMEFDTAANATCFDLITILSKLPPNTPVMATLHLWCTQSEACDAGISADKIHPPFVPEPFIIKFEPKITPVSSSPLVMTPVPNYFMFYDDEEEIAVEKKKTRRGKRKTAVQKAELSETLSDDMLNLCDLAQAEVMLLPDSMLAFPTNVTSFSRTPFVVKNVKIATCEIDAPVVTPVTPHSFVFGSFVPTQTVSRPSTPIGRPTVRFASVPPVRRPTPPFRFGFYRFDNYFNPSRFQEGWCIVDGGISWYMYSFAGKRWCISNKLRNRAAHATNGNGENAREAQNEIGRDIEQTLESTDRSNVIDVQAIKPQEEQIPDEATYLNPNTTELVYRRVQIVKVSLDPAVAVDTAMIDMDPFLKYYNTTLNHNSSMSTFRDVYFDLEFDVVVQALPAMAGIVHFVFDRFGGTGDANGIYSTEQLFAFPTQKLDLSSKDSLTFQIAMNLPYRVFNTVRTPFAGMGCGILKMFLATPMVVPAQMAMPATITFC